MGAPGVARPTAGARGTVGPVTALAPRACRRAARGRWARRSRAVALAIGALALDACRATAPAAPSEPLAPIAGGPRTCELGEALDPKDASCVPAAKVREMAIAAHVLVSDASDREILVCGGREPLGGGVLVVSGGRGGDALDCVPRPSVCPDDAPWSEAAARCVALHDCGPRATEANGRCWPIVQGRADVDVATWARLRLGVDGGEGEASLCATLARAPRTVGASPGAKVELGASIDLVFADNDVSTARAIARVTIAGRPASGPAAELVTAAIDRRVVELRRFAGTARAASLHLDVRCEVRGLAGPVTTTGSDDHGGGPAPSPAHVR